MRQIVLDTETTGLEPAQGHRVIEIGCVEVVERRLTGNSFHQYLQPDHDIDPGAVEVHGITNDFLADKPRFADIVDEFIEYVGGAELIIHNAPFDVGFLNNELKLAGQPHRIDTLCTVLDTLTMARHLYPGQKNSLDALCRRYQIDNSQRDVHGALLDAEILAVVYLAMTGGQVTLSLSGQPDTRRSESGEVGTIRRLSPDRPRLRMVAADATELEAHLACLRTVASRSTDGAIWDRLELAESSLSSLPGQTGERDQ